jgi:hypothetical protein
MRQKTIIIIFALIINILALPAANSNSDTLLTIYQSEKDNLSKNQWGNLALRSELANTLSTGKSIIIAVLDTGVDGNHPDLNGRVLPGYSTLDGKVYQTFKDFDTDGHGTHVAGIIAGNNDNKGITGVAPESTILPIKVLSERGGSDKSVADGIIYAIENGAKVINLSLGAEHNLFEKSDNITCQAIAEANAKNIIVIVSAGNSGIGANPVNIPASCAGAISVAAINANFEKGDFSSYDSSVFISGPGVDILSSIPTNATFPYDQWSGTSMAAPFISGAVALLLSKEPDLTYKEILARLQSSSIDLSVEGRDAETGYGLLDAYALLGGEVIKLAELSGIVNKNTASKILTAKSNTKKTDLTWVHIDKSEVLAQEILYIDNDKITSTNVNSSALKTELPFDAWSSGYLILATKTKENVKFSLPFYVFDIDFPVSDKPVLVAKISKIKTKWLSTGLEVTFSNNIKNSVVEVTLLDWEYSIFFTKNLDLNKKSIVIPVSKDNEMRAHNSVLVIGSPGNMKTIYIEPNYFLYGKVSNLDKAKISIKGTAINACFMKKLACEGAKLEIREYQSKKLLGTTFVMENLEFVGVIPYKANLKYVYLTDGKLKSPLIKITDKEKL